MYIDNDTDTDIGEGNNAIFDTFKAEQAAIEAEFGEELDWRRLPEKRACRILKRFDSGGLDDEANWDAIQDNMIDAMIRLDKTFRKRIKRLDV